MPLDDWLSPLLSFAGAGLGGGLVYRLGQKQEWARRFEGALEMLASNDPRQRALGRARVVAITRQGSASAGDRDEALAVLREDVRANCSEDVKQAVLAQDKSSTGGVWVSEDSDNVIHRNGVFVTRSLVETATAYVDVAGGADAAPDRLVVLISQATAPPAVAAGDAVPVAVESGPPGKTLPTDQRLILVKMSPDAVGLDAAALRDRARRAWRLSIQRVRSEPPLAVAAVAQQRVIGAWTFKGVAPDAMEPDRVAFDLGAELPDLVGREYRDTGQNPVRYWP